MTLVQKLKKYIIKSDGLYSNTNIAKLGDHLKFQSIETIKAWVKVGKIPAYHVDKVEAFLKENA